MRKFILALALTFLVSGVAFADGMNQAVSSTTPNPQWTATVFNDSGGDLGTGQVVVWDQADTDLTSTLYPYVTTVSGADSVYVAGVTVTPCGDQELCDIVVYGPALVQCQDSTDGVTAGDVVGTTASAGRCGTAAAGANTGILGVALTDGQGSNGNYVTVFVNPSLADN